MSTLDDSDRNGGLGMRLVANMPELTAIRNGGLALENARRNRRFIDQGQSLAALRAETVGHGDSAIVVAAGPSIRRHDPIQAIRAAKYRGALVVTDSAIAYCLRNGVVPDVAVTLDPDPKRIVRWFGDKSLTAEKLAGDDYFARQDLDPVFANQLRANQEIIDLLDEHGSKIRLALATSAGHTVVERALETGMRIYWWNPMLDDPDVSEGVTASLQRENGLPAVNAGGNVGTACWLMANMVLGKRRVALTGMDFSYYDDTPYPNTQYYKEALALVGEENLDALYMRIHNPYLDRWFFTDPAYMWYRECFLEMVADAGGRTYNCTQGGILFGDSIEFAPLARFLDETAG